MITKPLKLKGSKIHLNAQSDFGEILLELVDANGKLIAQSTPIHQDGLDIPVKWSKEIRQPQELVQLRIRLKNARLFALWCGP